MLGTFIRQTLQDRRERARRQKRASGARTLPRAAIVFGAGARPGLGTAIAERAARGGLRVYLTGRNRDKLEQSVEAIRSAGQEAEAVVVDVTDETQIGAIFDRASSAGYAVDLVIFNVGTNRPGGFLDIDPGKLEKSWRSDCLAGFQVGQHAVRHMLENGRGTILFTGASASLRGKAGFGQFAANKAGLRSLSQSMAREFGPQNIHVAHVIIDGIVDGARLRSSAPGLVEGRGEAGALQPDAVAEAYWMLYRQHRSSWSQEIDLRPSHEHW